MNRAVKMADNQQLPKNIAITEEVYKKLNETNIYYPSTPSAMMRFQLWEEFSMTYNDDTIQYFKTDSSIEIF